MNRFSKFLILVLVLALAACNRPQQTEEAGDSPPSLPLETDTAIPDDATDVPPNEEVPVPTAEDPTPQPPPPTEEIALDLGANRISMLNTLREYTFREVALLDSSFGWGIAVDPFGIGHILRTDDGGLNWAEITPPEPIQDDLTWFYPSATFIDSNHGFAAYEHSDLVWSTTNGGKSWHPVRLDFTSYLGVMIYSLDKETSWLFQYIDGGMQKVNTALYRTSNGGETWVKLLDPRTLADHSIQGFDKTGVDFYDTDNGFLTRFFRGVTPFVNLDRTEDGGATWYPLEISPPPSAPDAFNSCACGYYNPDFNADQSGSMKLECQCYQEGASYSKNYLYSTLNGGQNWDITSIPEGQLIKITDQIYYVIGREIYKTADAGNNWDLVKTVNWDGQFSFGDENTALGIAYDPVDDEYAMVKTSDGCQSFQIIIPEVGAPYTIR